jgi:hypothetical protein
MMKCNTMMLLFTLAALGFAGVARAGATGEPRDPLAYKVQELPGGSIATFDGWRIVPVMADGTTFAFDTCPQGREREFVLRVVIATPNAQDLANVFTLGPQLTQQFLAQLSPNFRRSGEMQKTTVGGDEARVEQYQGNLMGNAVTAKVMYVRRNDVAFAVMGIGTEAGFRDFGRAIEITAQSITFKESAIEPHLIGTWMMETSSRAEGIRASDTLIVASSRSITIYPNSTFTDSAHTGASGNGMTGMADGGSRGRVVKRGNVLTFHYDDGKTWSAAYSVEGGGLKLDGNIYLRQ